MTEEEVYERFVAIVDGVRARGLGPEVAELEALLPFALAPGLKGELARLLGFYWLRQKQHARAVPFSALAVELVPAQFDGHYNHIYSLAQLGRFDEAVAGAQRALQRFGEHVELLTFMANVLGHAGRLGESRPWGTRALAAKDAAAAQRPHHELSSVPLPPFDAGRPERQIISFSLFGALPKYVDMALANAEAARYIYPGWRCRFHVDASVPGAAVARLRQLGAQCVEMPGDLPAERWGTFWRFLVADDAGVDRWLLRDADSLINLREAAAVQQWLRSDRHFHVMRDHYDHSDLVLAGMWGGVRGALPPVRAAIEAFLQRGDKVQARTADQEFAREVLWPTMRRSVLAHDSQFAFNQPLDFAAWAQLPPGCHVGGDGARLLAFGGGTVGAALGLPTSG